MRPTIDEQLDGVRRLLDAVERDDGLSPASRELLTDAGRLVHRVRGSWATALPFLVEDNAGLAALLADLGAPADTDDHPAPTDVVAAAARNTALRGLLTETIRALPRDADGLAARARIAAYLRRRVDADPT